MKERNQVKAGAILSYLSLFINNFLGLVYTPFLLSKLGQSEYGLYSLVTQIIGYLTVLDLGFGNAIVVYTAKYKAKGEKEKEARLNGMFIAIFCIIGFIASIIGLILYFNVNQLFGATMTADEISKAKIMMLILTFNLAITFPFSVFSSIVTAYERFVFAKVRTIIRNLLMPIIMIPLLMMGYKAVAMVVVVTILNIYILASNTMYCFRKLHIKIKFGKFDMRLLKEIFAYSFFIFLAVLVDKVNWSVDQFVLGAVAGTIAVSLYAVAAHFNNIYLSFSGAINGLLLPKVSKMVAREESNEEISKLFIKTGRLQFIVMALVITGFVLFGKQFVLLWAGKDYITSYYIACILMIPVTIPLIQNVGISILQAKNLHKFRSVLYAVIAVANIGVSIPLAKALGGVGSAIGTAASLIIGNGIIINIYYYKKAKINIIEFWKQIIKMTIPIVPLAVVAFFVLKYVSLTRWITLGIGAAVYAGLYAIIAYFFMMNSYEKDLFLKPLGKVLKKIKK
ncbi:MAG: oligosaccharide flippase family protein [Clostridia bacterium]|nr:oligosaccharide flippase family protein [Clostridia bacterium]